MIQKNEFSASGIKFSVMQEGREIGRAFLYILINDLHAEPFGFLEDVFIVEEFRNKGHSQTLLQAVIQEAQDRRCYKLICTSRHGREQLHRYYQKLGFKDQGTEFRMDF